ncbi:MAG: sensor domain-containing diguanylate cyclase [Dolichospermum sp.]|nr:sensor domain-containing diguanylate cyclase [Dolichospermum sp.]
MMRNKYESPLHCNISIDNATDYYSHSLEYLLIVTQDLSQACSLDQIMEIALTAARKITKADGATFVVLDHGFCYYAYENSIAPLWKGQRVPLNHSIAGWVILNSQPVIISDIYSDERIIHNFYQHTFVKSMVMVSLGIQKPIGTIGIYWQNHHEPSLEVVQLLQTIANIAWVAMENFQVHSKLERQLRERTAALEKSENLLQKEIQTHKVLEAEIRLLSLTDELTGIHNRHGFFLLSAQQIRLAKRSRTNISILFIAIEGLKNIQDTWGQEYGDDAILSTARLLKRTCRNSDTIGRLEGSEFVVLAQGCDPDCQIIKQRLQNAINQFNESKQQPFYLAINIGVQAYEDKPHLSLDDLITLAQINSYQSPQSN